MIIVFFVPIPCQSYGEVKEKGWATLCDAY